MQKRLRAMCRYMNDRMPTWKQANWPLPTLSYFYPRTNKVIQAKQQTEINRNKLECLGSPAWAEMRLRPVCKGVGKYTQFQVQPFNPEHTTTNIYMKEISRGTLEKLLRINNFIVFNLVNRPIQFKTSQINAYLLILIPCNRLHSAWSAPICSALLYPSATTMPVRYSIASPAQSSPHSLSQVKFKSTQFTT